MIKLFTLINVVLNLMLSQYLLKTNIDHENLTGYWYCEDLSKSTIAIYHKNDEWFGTIIKSEDRSKIGKTPLLKFKYNHEKKEYIGIIQSSSGIQMDGTIILVNHNTIKLIGKKLFISKTFELKKQ